MAKKPFDSLDISHRQPGWQHRLIYTVDEELSKPFDWVNASCVDLLLASVLACHGPHHPVFKKIPQYKTAAEAKVTLGKLGGLEKVISKYFIEVPRSHAFDGDIALIQRRNGSEIEIEEASGLVLNGQIVGKRPPGARDIAFHVAIGAGSKFYRV
jgi:hypothetical protein